MGWGKGRPRVIKTILAGDELAAALERQQRWVEAHGDTSPRDCGTVVTDEHAPLPKYFRGARLQREHLRMAKAILPHKAQG